MLSRTKIAGVLACVCLSSTAAAQDQTTPFVPVLSNPAAGSGSYLALGDQIGTGIDVSTPANDFNIRGVSPAFGFYYVTGRGPGAAMSQIYQFDTAGGLIASFPQNQMTAVPSAFGHQDLTSDGEGPNFGNSPAGGRLWGGQEGGHWVRYALDASGALDAGTVLPVVPGVGTIRALTHIPGSSPERFISSGTSPGIFEIDEAGSLIASFTSGTLWLGFATNYNDTNMIWGATSAATPTCSGNPGTATRVRVVELDRTSNYTATGRQFCGGNPSNATAGGLGIFDGGSAGINNGSYTFAQLHLQFATTPDELSLYDSGDPTGTPTIQFCTAKTTLVCGAASMSTSGNSSATQSSGFTVAFGPTRGCRSGLILYTPQSVVAGQAFGGPGDGVLCLPGAGLRRAGPIDAGGTSPAVCDGNMAMDFNAFAQGVHAAVGCVPPPGQNNAPNFLRVPGTTVSAQGWGRDSVSTGQVLSDGRQWTVGP